MSLAIARNRRILKTAPKKADGINIMTESQVVVCATVEEFKIFDKVPEWYIIYDIATESPLKHICISIVEKILSVASITSPKTSPRKKA